jgi:uncharacterized protein GlcG (DUF336 family)
MPPRTRPSGRSSARRRPVLPCLERLEDRCQPSVSASLSGGTLLVNGDVNALNRIFITLDAKDNEIVVSDGSQVRGVFASGAVADITVNANGFSNFVRIYQAVTQTATLNGGPGNNVLMSGGGTTTLVSGPGINRLVGGNGADTFIATQGTNTIEDGNGTSTVTLAPRSTPPLPGAPGNSPPTTGTSLVGRPGGNVVLGFKDRMTVTGLDPVRDQDDRAAMTPANLSLTLGLQPSPQLTLTAAQVGTLLDRAAAATSFNNAIVAIVDRSGRVLGVRVESGVSPAITGNTEKLVFAIDGALAEARTGAFFANNQAPLTSRTIQFISQTTITQREVESDPSITDINSTLAGPGTVGPIGIGGNFPPGVPFTPQVDLFNIEETNRDTTLHPIYDASGNVVGVQALPTRFNVNPAFIPSSITAAGDQLVPPDSYGFISGLEPSAQPRGIGTLPGGLPIYENGILVGGIGVFFPGTTGFADEENSALSANFNPNKIDLSMVAEYIGFAAAGGSSGAGFSIGSLGGVAPLPGFDLPFGRIDLAGITLPIYGPPGNKGTETLVHFGQTLGMGNPADGTNQPVDAMGDTLKNGTLVPEGFLVLPHAGTTMTAAQVQQVIEQGVQQSIQTRAQIRLPLGSTVRMVFSVADPKTGEILGLFRMPDATVFSIDVAAAKSRNVSYYADPAQLQPIDQVPGIPPGTAFSNRTFRYLALPFFPEGINGNPPALFSILNVGGVNPANGLNSGPPLPKSAFFANVMGHNNFFPQTNFHDPNNPLNQNGIVFFPGGVPLYTNGNLSGGVGVSGDGVDEDDVVTFSAAVGFTPPANVLTADQTFVQNVRLPYQLFDRNPTNL